MFDWGDLRYFLAVARAGSTLAAAKSLNVNQSTVHRRLQALEKQLGCQLVKRHPTGYRLTELGEHILGSAESVENAVAEFERRVSASSKEIKGTVKVTCPIAVGARLLRSRLVDELSRRYPALRVEFAMSDQALDLAKGEADIAIRAKTPNDDALFGRKIADSQWGVYASRSYIQRRGSIERVEEINDHAVVMFSGELRDHQSARWLKSVAPKAHIGAHSNNLTALLMAVKSGAGLAPMPLIVAEPEKDLVRLLGPVAEMATPFYLLIHQDMRRTPRVRIVFDFLIERLPVIRPLLACEPKARQRPSRGRD
jgi:DNA-binding transcriptional LysR family regulator